MGPKLVKVDLGEIDRALAQRIPTSTPLPPAARKLRNAAAEELLAQLEELEEQRKAGERGDHEIADELNRLFTEHPAAAAELMERARARYAVQNDGGA